MPECESSSLVSRLILPIQRFVSPHPHSCVYNSIARLPRYQMLLSALTHSTDKDHPDYQALSKSLSLLKDVACRIDDNLKRIENKNKIYEIQNRLSGCPVSCERALKWSLTGFCSLVPGKAIADILARRSGPQSDISMGGQLHVVPVFRHPGVFPSFLEILLPVDVQGHGLNPPLTRNPAALLASYRSR